MAKDTTSDSAQQYVSVDELRIGLFVHVDLPWFRHPFALNSFRIVSEEQIQALRALGKARFRFDPARSLSPGEAETAPAETPGEADVISIDSPGDPPPPPPAREPPAPRTEKERRAHRMEERRQRIGEVNLAFRKSAALLRNLNRGLMSDSAGTLREIGGFVDQMAQVFLEHPEVTLHLMGEERWSEDLYSHHLNIAVLAMMVAKALDFSAEETRLLGQGALLHDIGLMKVPTRLLKMRPDELTQAERELRAMHCEYGLRLGRELGLPEAVLRIIFQHHEMVDGSGYPLGIKGEEIALPARVVSLVNYYEKLCNPDDPAQAMTPHGALSLMFGQRRGKFDAAALQRLIQCVGVYPPGSVVRLSDDSLALVVSVNHARPLRPWVMIYDSRVPREEAVFLDLERETGLNIVGALRPAMLPPAAAAYLSPRRRVVYFFDAAAPIDQGEDA
ncbi:MAG: DUF3391 domain-containing protein [Candidatus Accumulibacter sp.]|nr:DUF3391 domain-containing protein [Accumulibacter sp.]